jgi:hypothetical protein
MVVTTFKFIVLSAFIWQYILNFNTDYSFILKYLEYITTQFPLI